MKCLLNQIVKVMELEAVGDIYVIVENNSFLNKKKHIYCKFHGGKTLVYYSQF